MLRVVELFAGIGAQAAALDLIGAEWESVGIVEIDPYCVTAYNAIHGTDYKPSDITKVERLPECDLLTYSFPCTDISNAGKQKGFAEGSGTRSSLLWEVRRLLRAYTENGGGSPPKYLLMENVKALVQKKFKPHFNEWLKQLEELGYTTYWQVLNATGYGMPQNRERVIAVSILNDTEGFAFPKPIPLELKLKDLLEPVVDRKYYIKADAIQSRLESNFCHRNRSIIRGGGTICRTLTAREFKEPTCVALSVSEDAEAETKSTDGTSSCRRYPRMSEKELKPVGMLVGDKWDKMHDISRRVYDEDGVCPTIPTGAGGNTEVKILQRPRGKNDGGIRDGDVAPTVTANTFQENVFVVGALRGRNPENPSDRTAGAPTVQMLEIRADQCTNTITSVQKDNVVIEGADGLYTRVSKAFDRGPLQDKSRAIRAGIDDAGVLIKAAGLPEDFKDYIVIIDGKPCLVRKLTPKECWRLFGFTDEQFETAKKALEERHYKGRDKASSQLYKQAGNTIVIPMLAAVLQAIKGIKAKEVQNG